MGWVGVTWGAAVAGGRVATDVRGGLAGLVMALPAAAAAKILLNIFVLRREERGIVVPQLDLISTNDGGADFHEKHGPAGSTGETGAEKPAK